LISRSLMLKMQLGLILS